MRDVHVHAATQQLLCSYARSPEMLTSLLLVLVGAATNPEYVLYGSDLAPG